MKKFLFWCAVIFAVLTFMSLSAVGAKTAHADTPAIRNSVHFVSLDKALPRDTKLIHFTARGQVRTQGLHSTRVNVGLVCPENGLQRLIWRDRDGGPKHKLGVGQCLRTPTDKHINISVRNG